MGLKATRQLAYIINFIIVEKRIQYKSYLLAKDEWDVFNFLSR